MASVGQVLLTPLQASATSQMPAAARHTVPFETLASAGQANVAPSHLSSTSQAPAEARHTVPTLTGEQVPCKPSSLHDWQSVGSPLPHVVLQQKPSTHCPFEQ